MGARTDQKCSICKADEKVRAAVESLLQNKTRLDDIARESGFSRAALSRHSRQHLLRHALNRHRELKMNLDGRRIVTQWPTIQPGVSTLHTLENDSHGRSVLRYLTADELKPDDVLWVVSYEKSLPRQIPDADKENSPDQVVE